MDDEGFVTIQDRIKDMIISGGENVYPAEIEGLLATHPGIREAAVIGQESERWGESPLAIVVRSDDALTAGDVLEFCQGNSRDLNSHRLWSLLKRFLVTPAARFSSACCGNSLIATRRSERDLEHISD